VLGSQWKQGADAAVAQEQPEPDHDADEYRNPVHSAALETLRDSELIGV
jgi:hypothetical protein